MKKLVLVAVYFLSVEALASKARIQALGQSTHLIDPQTVYANPIDLAGLDSFVLLESGNTAASNVTDNAEAMVSYALDENHQLAFSFGHQDESAVEARNFINVLSGAAFELPQNPINMFYAVKDSVTSYAFGFFYSNKNDKTAVLTESSAGLSAAVEMGRLQLSTVYTLVNSAEAVAGKKFDGGGYWHSTVSYLLDNTKFQLTYVKSKAKMSTVVGALVTDNESHVKDVIMLGLVNSSVKDDNDFFWGAQLVSTVINCRVRLSADCDKAFSHTVLPAWIGIEAQASDWLIVRGTMKQSFLVNITKDELGYPAAAVAGASGVISDIPAGPSDAVVSLGLGFKFNTLTLDGVLSTQTTQVLNAANFLSQVGLTYNF